MLSLDYGDLKEGLDVWVKDCDTHKPTMVKIKHIVGMISYPSAFFNNAVAFPIVCETKDGQTTVVNFCPCVFYKNRCLLENDKNAIEV